MRHSEQWMCHRVYAQFSAFFWSKKSAGNGPWAYFHFMMNEARRFPRAMCLKGQPKEKSPCLQGPSGQNYFIKYINFIFKINIFSDLC
jgi:hypothetical protein